jgi:hypothetical protein
MKLDPHERMMNAMLKISAASYQQIWRKRQTQKCVMHLLETCAL